MTWESIGSTNTGQMPDDEAWILFSIGLAKQYVLFVCGDPPEGSKLGVMWHDHELGSYPSLAPGQYEVEDILGIGLLDQFVLPLQVRHLALHA